ncbi:riboflavin biosynthesis protein RibF [candidate division WOR-3 bacterium]|nr:riboflavin biosynthesis protein RibF [candidate division WOR-3 bacterium]
MKKSAVTVGIFDGPHLGHKKIFKKLLEFSEKKNLIPRLITFSPHPKKILTGCSPSLLADYEDKYINIKRAGIKNIEIIRFDEKISNMSAEEFLSEIVVRKFAGVHFVSGFNHHLGKDREGNSEVVEKIAESLNIGFTSVRPKIMDGIVVSSTYIRYLLNTGNVEKSAEMLGRRYKTFGTHIKGAGRGRSLGFPTINIAVNTDMTEVGSGVYIVRIYLDSKPFLALAFIGNSPTFSDGRKFEVFIPDWNPFVFGERVEVEFILRLRDVLKFDNIQELIRQIEKDVENLKEKKAGGLKCP